MKCPFGNCDNEEDNIHFDEPEAHIILTLGAAGHVHVHAPFEDEVALKRMIDGLIRETWKTGIDYSLPPVIEPRKELI